MSGTLYLVGTPIGNLGDFSERAVKILETCDFIAAEDTRVTLKLMNHFNIKKPVISYFEHNKYRRGKEIADRIENGENCALVTDAGMPAISDPGEDLVSLCSEMGISVTVIPGPCAAICALALSGLGTARFSFEGFLSANKKSRRDRLIAVRGETRTLIFYEAPHKLRTTVNDMLEILGDRRAAFVREMTKIHEETYRTTLAQAAEYYGTHEPRGEFVIILEGAAETQTDKNVPTDQESEHTAKELVETYMADGMTRPAAVKRASKETGVSRCELYKKSADTRE